MLHHQVQFSTVKAVIMVKENLNDVMVKGTKPSQAFIFTFIGMHHISMWPIDMESLLIPFFIIK